MFKQKIKRIQINKDVQLLRMKVDNLESNMRALWDQIMRMK